MLIQFIISIFAVIAIFGVVLRFRKGALSRKGIAIWLLLWVAVLIALWNPTITNRIAGFLGVGRGADAVLYVSSVVLFYTMFRLYGRLEHLEHQLSEMAKKSALKDLDK